MNTRTLLLMVLAGGLATAQAQLPSYVPASGLAAWYGFNGNADDASGNGNHGTVMGASPTADRFGFPASAYAFDRSQEDMVMVPASPSLDTMSSITVSFWSDLLSYAHYNHCVCKTNLTSVQFCAANTLPGSGGLTFVYGGTNVFISQQLPVSGTWSHVVHAYDWTGDPGTSKHRLYINGIAVDSMSVTSALTPSTHPLYIGSPQFADYATDGALDDIGIWSRALDAAELAALFEGGVGIAESAGGARISLAPVPTTGLLAIGRTSSERAAFRIVDMQGRAVEQGVLAGERTQVDLSALAEGNYILRIDGEPQGVRFTKQD